MERTERKEPSIERIEARVWVRAAGRDSEAIRLAIPRFRHTFGATRLVKPWSSPSWVRYHPRSPEPARPGHPPAQA
jgi:hypothetical protein